MFDKITESVHNLIRANKQRIDEARSSIDKYRSKILETDNPQEKEICNSRIYHSELMVTNYSVLSELLENAIKEESIYELEQALNLAEVLGCEVGTYEKLIKDIRKYINAFENGN